MVKKFDNIAEDGVEKALRRGYVVPEGGVNLAWVKSPKLTPENNVVIIDTSKTTAENQNLTSSRKQIAFANALGILEDENGNQIWTDEYPIISDVFTLPEADIKDDDYTVDTILPFMHVSRYFHIDFAGLAFASLDEFEGSSIRVVDKNGTEFTNIDGSKRYKIYLVQANGAVFPDSSRQAAYRVYAFLDMDVQADELYLTYEKVELNIGGGIKNQELNYKERINARPYFKYVPEESDVADHSNSAQKIYSSKPSNMKQQALGLPQPNYAGWKYYVPRKAIPDPRIFQIFRWRLACEFTQPVVPENASDRTSSVPTATIRVGVVIPPNGNHMHTRANFFFYQLNQSDYNFSKINFINPLSEGYTISETVRKQQVDASYWHVDIGAVTFDELAEFDVLLWAPSAASQDISPYLGKINYFVENLGGTFLFETSSGSVISGLNNVTFSPAISGTIISPSITDTVNVSTLRMYTPPVSDTTPGTFGVWQSWPPNPADILNTYKEPVDILTDADNIAGWALDDGEKTSTISAYKKVANSKFQYISSYDSQTYKTILEAFDTRAEKTYLRVSRSDAGVVLTPDANSLDVTGDLSIIMRISLDNWITADYQTLLSKYDSGSQNSYVLDIEGGTGKFRLVYSINGSSSIGDFSTVVPPLTDGTTYWIRAMIDVDNGAGGRTTSFWYAPDSETEPTSWTQIGSNVTSAGVISIFPSTSPVAIGKRADISTARSQGNYYRTIIRGSLTTTNTALDIDWTVQNSTLLTATASTGHVFTIPELSSWVSVFAPTYHPTLLQKKYSGGGNIFVSTSGIFEDHLFDISGNLAARSLQVSSINTLADTYLRNFRQMVSSQNIEGEMKLRLNVMLFSTLNKPSPTALKTTSQQAGTTGNTQTTTIYTDWESSWVIDPSNDVLSEDERSKFDFVLLPTKPSDTEPTWQRILSKKNVKQLIKEKIIQLDPTHQNPIYNSFDGASKRYFLIATNPLVQVYTTDAISDTTIPTAWTTAYSPKFEVPTHLGSYAVRDEMIQGVGHGDGRRVYPPKPYQLQSNVSYMVDSTVPGSLTAIVSLTGTAKKTVKAPDQTQVRKVWVPATASRLIDVVLHWDTDGANKFENIYRQQSSYPKPIGMDTWTSANYNNAVPNNWPYPGLHGTLSVNGGDRGTLVKVAQEVMNQAIFWGLISGPALVVDGIYNSRTAAAVRRFQVSRGAKYVDGIIDAETWSLIGYYLISLSQIPGFRNDFLAPYIANAKKFMLLHSVSDDNKGTVYVKQSWESGGPGTIREGFMIRFNSKLPIYRVSIMPYTAGTQTDNLTIDWLDLTPRSTLYGYNFSSGYPGPLTGRSGGDGDWIHIPVSSINTDTVVFRAKQTGRAGWGTARVIGIRDVAVYAKKLVAGVPGHYVSETVTVPGGTYEETVSFTFQAQMSFEAGVPKVLSPTLGLTSSTGNTLYDIKWDENSLQITPDVYGNYFNVKWNASTNTTSTVKNSVELTYNGYNNILSSEIFINGPKIGDGSNAYYTRTKTGTVDPYEKSYGWIQKDEGLKLICRVDGTPYGFPTALPNQVNSTSTHFARYRLNAFNTDQTMYYGFYDAKKDEFITNSAGEPEVTYYDYVRRGPSNIYIAIRTTYELDTNANVPGITDTVTRPFKWAMPVYGVTSGLKSKIQIEPLSPSLGQTDLWAIPITAGSFSKSITLRPRDSGSFTNYLKDYQGTTVTAFYSVPEAKSGPWSALYGRPYVDIRGEVPIILDDNTIQVRQAPILQAQVPTSVATLADPWKPIFKVYKRANLTSAWTEIPFTEVEDYSVWDGTITLKTALTTNDPRLVKVDYTSTRSVYYMKTDGQTKINLNPYLNKRSDLINKPLYVYVLPEYVTDANGAVITSSVQTRTVHFTTSSSLFSPSQVDYDPSALLIGIIYISNATDINDLIVLDTRKRGGGAHTAYENGDLFKLQSEAESYWDIIPDKATSYQKGGFVIVRLPSALKNDFTLEQITTIIERNLTIGLGYRIEDLQGNRWQQ